MLAFAQRELLLDSRTGDGPTQREAYASHRRQGGPIEEQLEPLECPEEAYYLWEYFCSMNARRTGNGFGPNPITDEGVMAWAARRGIILMRIEHEALDALEALFMSIASKKK